MGFRKKRDSRLAFASSVSAAAASSSAPPVDPHGGSKPSGIDFNQSMLFDWMWERYCWGLMSASLMYQIADLVLADFETFKVTRPALDSFGIF